MSKLLVIVGSTRPGRAADLVVPWVTSRARGHGGFDVEVADLRDWPLPIFAEHPGTIGDIADPTYSEPIVRAWNQKVKQADAFVVVTPEHLAHVFIEAEAVPLRNTVVIPFVRTAFGADGGPSDPEMDIRLQVMLDDLAWWSAALENARAAGELVPGSLRARAALAAAQA